MILKNIFSLSHNRLIDLEIKEDLLAAIETDLSGDFEIKFSNAIVFPGLINSHDHLDFNLFPRLGNRKYNNYTEWGPTIQSTYASNIDTIIQIPQNLRYNWGIIKNLLGGVTSVVHHGTKFQKFSSPIRIIDQFQHLHSVHFEKYWKLRLNNPLRRKQYCVIHSGEGIDDIAYNEINELIRFNFLKKKLIGVHGVCMDGEQAKSFTGLVWCPQSNEWMFSKTAEIEKLKQLIPIVFGTDSTLTSDWNIWNHIRDARKMKKLTDTELIQALTCNAANLWKLNAGSIEIGKAADLVVAEKREDDPVEAFFHVDHENILLIISNGRIVLMDEKIINGISQDNFYRLGLKPIILFDRVKYMPEECVNTIQEIQKYPGVSLPCKIVSNAYAY
jgi:Cytosine deaminase and related metal-dependent hydrolases